MEKMWDNPNYLFTPESLAALLGCTMNHLARMTMRMWLPQCTWIDGVGVCWPAWTLWGFACTCIREQGHATHKTIVRLFYCLSSAIGFEAMH